MLVTPGRRILKEREESEKNGKRKIWRKERHRLREAVCRY
jgi:hypothetical protein